MLRQRTIKGRNPICKCGALIEESRRGKYGDCKTCHASIMKKSRKKKAVNSYN